jgi:hypothetical protein
MTDLEIFHELSFYTLSHKGVNFIHQHIVDAYTAQTATIQTKPISIYFALIGLHLFVDKKFTGKKVQQAHIDLAKRNIKSFENISLPEFRGHITVSEVINIEPGDKRDEMIALWCASVWGAYSNEQKKLLMLFNL